MIRILLVDDQPLFVESLRISILSYADDMEIVGIANDGNMAISMARNLKPDVILMDVYMPNTNGVSATKKIMESQGKLKIIMLSTYDEDEFVHEALHFGAAGYLLKDISPTELIASIRALMSGVVQISPKIAANLINEMYNGTTLISSENKEQFIWFKTLTDREKEVFGLIATGYANQQIEEHLGLAEQTVRNHISKIYSKLEVKNRFEIIQLATKIHYH